MFEHQHPLSLVDLQLDDLNYEEEEEDNDDEKHDLTIKQELRCQCDRCGQEINWFHRYYYKCDQCVYSIHKFCAQLPPTLEHASHIAHTLFPFQLNFNWRCDICQTRHDRKDLLYRCPQCYFYIDVSCALKWLKSNIIHHPSHMHPLICMTKRIMCECDACGKEHKGIFYQCTTCPSLFFHSDCAFLPKKLLIQDATDDFFFHTHPLTLAYSHPKADQKAKFYPRCRVCFNSFPNENLWIYKCDKCRYYAHLDCATAREEPFMSIFSSAGFGKTLKNFADAEYPDLLHLPFPDQTYSILKHIFFKKMASQTNNTNYEGNLRHMSHQHPLILVDHTQGSDITKPSSSKVKLLSCHNPMKKIELLCNGCLRPITNMPFYKCANEDDESCDFVLHEWCTRLPDQVLNHPGHPQHALVLLPIASHKLLGVFKCVVCRLRCNGFVYSCVECEYHIDVSCAFIPDKIVHEAHPNHLIWRVQSRSSNSNRCRSCVTRGFSENGFSFSCRTCKFDLHPECALLLPQTISHKFDKHPMKLSYFPIENHKSQYFCEVCEEEFDPEFWFYHCYDCVQSIHSACAPLILECKRAAPFSRFPRRIYKFLNIKFGSIHNIEDHLHPVSFVQGIENDGKCNHCLRSLWYKLIFKCLQCKYVIHFECCKSFNNW